MTEPPADATATLAFREVPWRLGHVVIGITPLVAVVTLALTPSARALPPTTIVLAALGFYAWVLAFPLGVAWRFGWRPRFAFSPTRMIFELVLATIVVAVVWAVLALGDAAWVAAFGEPPARPAPLDRAARSPQPLLGLLAVAMLVILGPVAEEVFFRGMLYRALRRSTLRVVAVLVQAAAFGLLHAGYGSAHVVASAAGGIALALVYDARQTLVAPIFCHILHNGAVVALAALAGLWALDAPALGVRGEPHETGMTVTSVTPNSGAEAAGIRAGDVLYSVNGWGARTTDDVMNAIHNRQPGESVPVEYIRDGALHRVEVVLKSRRELKRESDAARDRP